MALRSISSCGIIMSVFTQRSSIKRPVKFVRRIRNQLLLDTHRENGSALHPAGQRTNGTRARPLWRPARTRSTRPRLDVATARTRPTTHGSSHIQDTSTGAGGGATPHPREPAAPSTGPTPTGPTPPHTPGTPACHRTGRARLRSRQFLRSSPVPPGHQEEPSRSLQPEIAGGLLRVYKDASLTPTTPATPLHPCPPRVSPTHPRVPNERGT